jgi:hypothetical protein
MPVRESAANQPAGGPGAGEQAGRPIAGRLLLCGLAAVLAGGLLFGVGVGDAGVASATVDTAQQVGATTATTTFLAGQAASPAAAAEAAVHGYTTAFWWAAAIFATGAVICGLLLHRTPRLEPAVELAPA